MVQWHPDKGFIGIIINYHEKTLVVTKLCGDGMYWLRGLVKLLEDLKAQVGIDKLFYTTFRRPAAFCKLVGGHVVGAINIDGKTLYQIRSDLDRLKEVIKRRDKTCPE